jgi:hypothetical protein
MASAGKLVKVYGRKWGNISNELGTGFQALGEEQYVTVNQTYEAITASTITFTTSISNGVYLLQSDLAIYLTPDNGNGANSGFQWNNNLIVGTNGGLGDTWQRAGHGVGAGGSNSIVRKFVYSPGLQAGTQVTARVMVGQWGSVSARVNYAGYSNYSDFQIWEFQSN